MSETSASSSRPPSPVTAVPDTARPYRFNWDPANRRPGPESVSGTTSDGRGYDHFNAIPQLGNLNLNASATSLALGSVPTEWSSSRQGFNAISTVLNNPHKRQAPPKAHSALPSVPPSELPRVRRKDFDPYLQSIASEWDRFEHLSQHQPEAGPSTARALPSLEGVPSVFFGSQFNLADPNTFASVTELNLSDNPDADPAALAHSLPLLEKFSHYADIVEMHLTHEISLRSSSFFAALSNLHHLQAESTQCLSQISRLRDMLKEVDNSVAKRGLEVIQLERRMQDMKQVEEGMAGVKGVVELSGSARHLLSQGKWHEALDVVDALEKTWSSEVPYNGSAVSSSHHDRLSPLPPTPEEEPIESKVVVPSLSVPLSSLRAFSALPDHLRSLSMEIVASLSADLTSALRGDLLERVEGSSSSRNEKLKLKVEPILEGLVRTKGIKEAILSWRETTLSEMRTLVNKNFPLAENDPSPQVQSNGNGADAGGRLRDLSHSDFMKLLQTTYGQLLRAIEGLHTQGAAIGEVLQSIHSLRRQHNPDTLQSEFTDILGSVTELSHVLVAKVIGARSDQHTLLALHEFWEFFNATWSFVIDCEVLCRRMVVGLRGVLVGQGKTFLQLFHQTRLNQSAKLVEDEQWNPKEVLPELQHTVNLLVDSAVKDVPELLFASKDTLIEGSSPTTNARTTPNALKSFFSSAGSTPASPSSTQKMLSIEDRSYFTVLATSEVMTLLLDYLKVIVNLGMLVTDTMSRVIEFLKAFNSRTCQVVLGAGAMRSAGLKNITAKHLALASQSLSIMIALIPYIRETFRRHLSPKQAVMLVEFDKLKRDYQEHQNEIHAKLIAIMGDRLSAHVKSLKAVDWTAQKPASGVNGYMELLVKETVTLHKVLSRYLSTSVVQDVMTQVFAAINHRLSGEYTKLELPHAEAKERLLADVKFLHTKLTSLHNVGVPTNMLELVISEKSVPGPPPAKASIPTRSSSLATSNPAARSSTNLRLKGLLSRGLTLDKALPPTETLTSSPSSSVSSLPLTSNGVYESNKAQENGYEHPLPPPPIEDSSTSELSSSGYKQIEGSMKEAVDSEATSEPLRDLRADTATPPPPVHSQLLEKVVPPMDESEEGVARSATPPDVGNGVSDHEHAVDSEAPAAVDTTDISAGGDPPGAGS